MLAPSRGRVLALELHSGVLCLRTPCWLRLYSASFPISLPSRVLGRVFMSQPPKPSWVMSLESCPNLLAGNHVLQARVW